MLSGIIKKITPSRRTLLALIAVLAAYNYYENRPKPVPSSILQISTGKIQGVLSRSREGKEFYQYKGIPYAKAPVGELRFEPPQPPVNWEGVRDTNSFGSECIQINPIFRDSISGSEDCLFLNVFTPKIGSEGIKDEKMLLPTMVWVHGGYYSSGSSNNYPGNYFMDEYVVLVTLNYRLASLGFLNTGDGVISGNMGLKDQTMALKWVQQNIKKFGGDPTRVTLFGESAGASSVNFHMMSNMSKGLFHKAISQSGTVMKVWATQVNPKGQTDRLIELLNCTRSTSLESVRCLKGLKAETIIEIHKEASAPIPNNLHSYAPSIEIRGNDPKNNFITEDPKAILESGRGNNVPWMIGMNSGEGLLYSGRIINREEFRTQYEREIETIFPQIFVYDKTKPEITRKIKKFYFNAEQDENIDFIEKFRSYTDLFSDRYYSVATKKAALLQSKYSSVYLYYNDYSSDFTLYDFLSLEGKLPAVLEVTWKLLSNWYQTVVLRSKPTRYGVCHGDELSLLFPFLMVDVGLNSNDYEMSRALIKLWVQFAYDDTKMKHNGVSWTRLSPNAPPKYLQFSNDAQSNKLISEPFKERVKFWDSLNLPN